VTPPATEMRKTGVHVMGDMPWGTHLCLFYKTRADLQDKPKLLRDEPVVILKREPEERVGLDQGAATSDKLATTVRNKVRSGEFLEYAHRVSGAENCDSAG
jgi:hypothetical protein